MEEWQQFFSMNYEWLRALHIIAIIAWMAALFYLPRLFVYHAETAGAGSDKSETFKIMERKLLKIIMNPAMIASWIFGLLLLWANPYLLQEGWMHAKLLAVVLLSAYHGVCVKWTRTFAQDRNVRSGKYYRLMNEVPTVLMIVIVIAAVVQPF